MSCLDDRTIEDLVRGVLPPQARVAADAHVAACADCRSVVAEYIKWAIPDADELSSSEPSAALPVRTILSPMAPGSAFGRHRILRPLGAGGGGAVYEAFDPQLGRRVAIKVLHEGGADEGLLHEARAMAQLNHPGIVSVYDVGVVDGHVFLVMELVEGETLSLWLRRTRRRWPEVLRVLIAAARGLAAAHQKGVIHGDVKPDNFLIGTDGNVRVSDFGLASVPRADREETAWAAPAGTPGYVAPEVMAGAAVDARADQWALGLTAYRALVGDPPAALAPTPSQPLGPRTKGQVPTGIVRALKKAMATNPADRFLDVTAFIGALESATLRRRVLIGAGAVLVAMAVVAAAWPWGPRGLLAHCGNQVVDPGEDCDDGNNTTADGCDLCLRCPVGALTGIGRGCYTLHEKALGWAQAQADCATRGETLATFPDQGSYGAVAKSLRTQKAPPVWIGLRRDDTSTGAIWLSGAPIDSSLRHMIPVPTAGPMNGCAAIETPDYRTRWVDSHCDEARAYVCERRPWKARPATGHGYKVIHELLTWDEARAKCQGLGGYLVTIADGDEQAFVSSVISKYTWLGGGDRDVEGDYRWANGDTFSFRAFAPNQPNNKNGSDSPPEGEDCLAIGAGGGWHDARCDGKYAAACEIE